MLHLLFYVRHLACAFTILCSATLASAQKSPDILVLGDSQISTAGSAYTDFFNDLATSCGLTPRRARKARRKLGDAQTGVIGVRSTSLNSWVARDGNDKDTICEVDARFGVNAGVFGIGNHSARAFVQIGEGRDFQFCRPNKSAFEALFDDQYYDPKLLVLAFLGNAAERWANDPSLAKADVKKTLSQIPNGTPCIFMTTIPVYAKETNDMRMRALRNIKSAFQQSGQQCQFVQGFNTRTRRAIEGNPKYFRKRADGSVRDPLHPSEEAANIFMKINRKAMCKAVFASLR